MMVLFRIILLLLPFASGSVFALGLGDAFGQSVIGQPLAVRIPLTGEGASNVAANCVSLHAPTAHAGGSDTVLTGATISIVAGGAAPVLLVTTRTVVSQPILSFGVRVKCGYELSRDYHLLSAPPTPAKVPEAVVLPAVPVAGQGATPAISSAAALDTVGSSVRKSGAAVARPVGEGKFVSIEKRTTLRLMSRQRYPDDSRLRVAYIRRIAAANQDMFANPDAAMDQALSPGQQVWVPKDLPPPQPRSAPSKPLVRSPVATSGRQEVTAGQGRLIIGAAEALPSPTAAELEASITRLIDVMNEQMVVQVAMAERLNALEKSVSEAKQAASMQLTVQRNLESEIQRLREDQSRSSYIQLILAILIGGLVGATLLRWRGQRVAEEANAMDDAPTPASHHRRSTLNLKPAGRFRLLLDGLFKRRKP